ncbi:dihydroneopterin aldolase [Carboxydothermus hydrogenoformans]|uniref:7,8-dihydroneopterin aldolase n=1 Tax=Carboxydothermus hydrogenoformans (strain ATCC BAA-161 / DSM 6008 / Z-2901) TaxID=246194 RepID=Q3A9K5_CARHZ|nr:dihydroneopterin aldolase [Carboxydothermus hydrogenoformans]ABB14115.1 dihydroneopterin aldolase [Carboxydothermus hydrogenoformans Z-2901]
MDKIVIKGVEFYAFHGVLPEEKALGQKFILDLELGIDLRDAGRSDDLSKTVSYKEVLDFTEEIVTKNRFDLIEALAEEVAGGILNKFSLIKEVMVRVHKPGAPLRQKLSDVYVEVKRGR